jgi:hypothetical protein
MPGVRPLRRIQIGAETTAGTGVAATALWRGTGTIEDTLELKHAEEDVGYLTGLNRTYLSSVMGKLTMAATPATYEQTPYILTAGIRAVTTGVADGSGSGKIFAYPASTNAQATATTYTIEGGDNQQEEEMAYSFVEKFKMSGKSREAITISADWVGRQVAPSSFTAQPSTPSVDSILFQNAKLYLDAIGGTIGTTQKTQTFLGFELDVTTGLMPVFTGDGELYFSVTKMVGSEWVCKVTFEHDGTSVAEKANWRAQTPRLMQIKVVGPAVTTAGTTYANKTLLINLPGKWRKFEPIGEIDGNDIVAGEFVAEYDSTAAIGPSITVVNELTALV